MGLLQLRKKAIKMMYYLKRVMCFENKVSKAHNLLIVGMEVSIYMNYNMG